LSRRRREIRRATLQQRSGKILNRREKITLRSLPLFRANIVKKWIVDSNSGKLYSFCSVGAGVLANISSTNQISTMFDCEKKRLANSNRVTDILHFDDIPKQYIPGFIILVVEYYTG
jgi:hypothetical protein